MDNFTLGITLMLIGMITVFIILLIVIYLSRLLIVLVNKFAPEKPALVKGLREAEIISPTTMKVIVATVNKITGGKGIVKSVEKM